LHPDLNSSNLDARLPQFLDKLRGKLAQFRGDGGVVRRKRQRLPLELSDMAGAQQGRRSNAPVVLLQSGQFPGGMCQSTQFRGVGEVAIQLLRHGVGTVSF